MFKNKKIIIIIFALIFTLSGISIVNYFFNNNINYKENDNSSKSIKSNENEDKKENISNQEEIINNNQKESSENIDSFNEDTSNNESESNTMITPKQTTVPKQTTTPKQNPNNDSSINSEIVEKDNNNNQKESISNDLSDLETAIKYQLEAGDPITYNESGEIITVQECMKIGEFLVNQQEITKVYQYECPFTQYGNAVAVGLYVCFQNIEVQQCLAYDEYKIIINKK